MGLDYESHQTLSPCSLHRYCRIGNGNDSAQNIPRYGHVPFIDLSFSIFFFFYRG